jgi:hypothetical protein
MPGLLDKKTFIVGLSVIDLEKMPVEFIKYDTEYIKRDGKSIEYYDLPKKGKFMILVLFTKKADCVWTTIRRWTPRKEEYYQSLIGKEVEIVTPYENN